MTTTRSSRNGNAPGGTIKFTPSIQYLRAVAALSVVVYHVLHQWLPQYTRYDVLSSPRGLRVGREDRRAICR
jgi:peptidoglycan/LPS O-acetylase OafA/YrhL